MRMNRMAALTLSAGLITMAACSDSPTAPTKVKQIGLGAPSLDLGATDATPELGKYKICKAGNIGGSFDVSRTAEGASTGTVSGDNTIIAENTCYTVAEDNGGNGVGSNVSFTEDAQDNVVSSITGCKFIDSGGGISDCQFNDVSRFINSFHGFVVTVTNTFTPPTGCTYTQGYWKTHGPTPKGNNSNEWDLTTITLGTVNYTQAEALSIFNTPVAGNGLIALAHQLMAAKLNLANGAVDPAIGAVIAAADALIGSQVIPPVGTAKVKPSVTADLVGQLAAFNEGLTGPGHCGDEVLVQ